MKMKLFLLLPVLAVFAVAAAASADLPAAFAPENTYTFEAVPEGAKITHEFVVRNKGTAPLKIESVKTG